MTPDALAGRYGTPLYGYDLAALRRAHDDLHRALPQPSTLYYSLKANPHPALVAALAARGCHAEVTSSGEVAAAVVAGVAPERILLTGPAKTGQTIGYALDCGVRRFSVDSPVDIARVDRAAGRYGTPVDCLLRVNADVGVPGMGLSMTGTPSQFGADAGWVTAAPGVFTGHRYARITGLHLYMGTNLPDEEVLLRQFGVAVTVARHLTAVLGDLDEIDLGGGFGAPYARAGDRPRFPTLAGRLADLLDRELPGWRDKAPRVSFESGRYLVGDCGTLVCTVLDRKDSKGETFTVLDAGINHLGGMAGLRRLPPLVPTVQPVDPGPVPAPAGDAGATARTSVVGPLCTPLDSLARAVPLPPVRVGQYVTVPNVGAYGLTASLLAFLGHPAPVEVVHDGDVVVDAGRLHLTRHPVPESTPAEPTDEGTRP
ncbi:type III PLP-dependent enzyme [Micromonospora echinofusca]|uniref:Type III PLP-dependent enzyme n=1 Tax=Micromonospora echinofusca TaxID=47858 RepID=A0ABS3VJC4_MICEH|nr:type III PLP-dependent enzyme [Micromonospora echinofusca]MBO4204632.1 type III PLP-dependent enzyme [Micromonospora echinofusca]